MEKKYLWSQMEPSTNVCFQNKVVGEQQHFEKFPYSKTSIQRRQLALTLTHDVFLEIDVRMSLSECNASKTSVPQTFSSKITVV